MSNMEDSGSRIPLYGFWGSWKIHLPTATAAVISWAATVFWIVAIAESHGKLAAGVRHLVGSLLIAAMASVMDL